ncbi:MAG: hypothetical protein ACPL3A_09190 [Thermoanaerobacteraceae bacterium]
MELKVSKIKNFIFGKVLYDKNNENEYIQLLIEKYGDEFFEKVYIKFLNGLSIDSAFKELLEEQDKLKSIKIKNK